MDIPDLRQQWRELLVLEAQCKDLLRVDTAEGAEADQLHQHARKHQLVLQESHASSMHLSINLLDIYTSLKVFKKQIFFCSILILYMQIIYSND